MVKIKNISESARSSSLLGDYGRMFKTPMVCSNNLSIFTLGYNNKGALFIFIVEDDGLLSRIIVKRVFKCGDTMWAVQYGIHTIDFKDYGDDTLPRIFTQYGYII